MGGWILLGDRHDAANRLVWGRIGIARLVVDLLVYCVHASQDAADAAGSDTHPELRKAGTELS